jgi:hypothetical protein
VHALLDFREKNGLFIDPGQALGVGQQQPGFAAQYETAQVFHSDETTVYPTREPSRENSGLILFMSR